MGKNELPAAGAEPATWDQSVWQHLPLLVEALDARGRIVFWNTTCERVTGYPADEVLADPQFLRRLYPGAGRYERMLDALARCGPAFTGAEQTLCTKGGALLTIAWSEIPLPPASAAAVRWFVGSDVTEARRARDALRTSEARYRQLVDNGRDLIALHDPDGRYRFLSPAVTTMLGYEAAELLGATPSDFHHPDDRRGVQRKTNLLAGKAQPALRHRFRRKNGRYAWLETVVVPLFENADDPLQVTALLTTSRDVSAQTDAAQQLATSEERLRLALLATGIGIFDIHLPAYAGHVSNECLRVYGYGPEDRDRFERGWIPLVHPEDCATYVDYGLRRERGELGEFGQAVRRMHRDGRYIWVRTVGRVVERDGAGRARRVIGTVQDVDTQKREEHALLNSRARLEQAQAMARIGDWRSDVDNPLERWSDGYYRLLGRSPETCVPNLESFLATVHPDDLEAVRHAVAAENLDGAEYGCRVVWPDGTVRHVHCRTQVLRDPAGRATGLAGTMQDVTERRLSEVALRTKAAQLEGAQRVARVGSWTWTIEGDQVTWTPEVFRILGLDPARPALPFAEQVSCYKPESWRRLQATVQATLAHGEPYEIEVEFVRADGTAGWAVARGELAHDELGSVSGLVGTVQDITERKRAEVELRDARDRVRALSSHLEDELNLERKRIALDVHDELGQLLTATRLQLDLLLAQPGDRVALERSAGRLRDLIEHMVEVTRNVAINLRPPALDLGLVPALEWLAEDFALRAEITCSVRAGPAEVALDDKQATELFRIAQAALTNVARHAQARKVEIRLMRCGDRLTLCIRDDGRGFDPAAVPALGHFGLLGMRERALRLGADLVITSRIGAGTEIRVELPAPQA